ncbi:hypothetical protein GQ600_4602 [Phytophthora cactorum]|nr:hypothetical protein GQ600_4602 [Phytophthora cactorum]
MSFAEEESSQVLGPSDGEQPSTKVEEQVGTDDQVDNALEADDHQGDIHADNQVNQEDLNGGKDAEAEKKSTERAEKDDEPNETKNAPKTQKNQSDSEKKSGVVTWKFADRPLVNGMTKAQRKRAKAKEGKSSFSARVGSQIARGKIEKKNGKLRQVVALLDGSYNMVDALVLSTVEVRGKLSVRSYAVGQDIPVVKSIPQMNKIMEAIETIKIKDDIDLLAYWPDGYTKFDQLDGMASIIEARNHFILVMRTMRWIDDWNAYTCNVTKVRLLSISSSDYTKTNLILWICLQKRTKGIRGNTYLRTQPGAGQFVAGHQLLDFRENL